MATTATTSSTSASSTANLSAAAASALSSPTAVAKANKANAQKLISSLGAGSGVDVASLAQNLVDAEKIPQQNAINAKITKNEARISGYSAMSYVLSQVQTAFTALKDQSSFNGLSASNTNTTAFDVTASSSAAAGTHEVNVLQVAKSQRTVSDGVALPTTPLNAGQPLTLSLTVGTTNPVTKDIQLAAGYDTPQALVDAVNAAGTGITAQLVNTGDGSNNPYQIVFSGPTGSAGAFTLTPKFSAGGVSSATASVNHGAAMKLRLSASGTTLPDITLAAGHDTPQDIVNAVNATNSGVHAELVANPAGSTYPFKMMLTGPNGNPTSFSLSADYNDGKGFQSMVTPGLKFTGNNPVNQSAADALVKVDGITFTRFNNSLTDVIPGVTLNLKGITTSAASINLTRDNTGVKDKINALVAAYNDANTILGEVSNPKSTLDTYGATLVGDSTVRTVKQQLRSMFMSDSSTPGSSVQALWQLGINIDQTGVMSVDTTKLDTALNTKYSDVVKTFTGNQNGLSTFSTTPAGIAGDAVKKLTSLLGSNGVLASQSSSATKLNTKYQDDLTKLQTRMDTLLTRYQKQFAAMDSLVGSVNTQKTSLKSTFDGMMATLTGKNG